jgi:hypothetical protein
MGIPAPFLACLLLFQNPAELFQKAPPAVDEALRARISKFFQAHVDGKFRAAAEVVAEDSQDAFFTANKPRCYSFEIVKITYSENFTRAAAVVACEADYPAPGFAGVKVKAPRTTFWKLEGGHWWYYIDPNQGQQTPFGLMRPGPGQGSLPPGIAPGSPPAPPPNLDVQAVLSWVKASEQAIHFSSARPGSGEVTLTNRGNGTAQLILRYSGMPGLEVKLDRTELNQGETARLTATWTPGEAPPPAMIPVSISVQPIGQLLGLRLIFTPKPGK